MDLEVYRSESSNDNSGFWHGNDSNGEKEPLTQQSSELTTYDYPSMFVCGGGDSGSENGDRLFTTQKGRIKLEHEGYYYTKDKNLINGYSGWYCDKKVAYKCKGRIRAKDNKFVNLVTEHNHPPEPGRVERRQTEININKEIRRSKKLGLPIPPELINAIPSKSKKKSTFKFIEPMLSISVPTNSMPEDEGKITRFRNCSILRDGRIVRDDLWLRNGKILNPEPIFFDECVKADIEYDSNGALIVPGFIDLQINGGFGYDFSDTEAEPSKGLDAVSDLLLQFGVTAFCPTLISQSPESYAKILPNLNRKAGGLNRGATVLGVHLEGPFISADKRGAHPKAHILDTPVWFKEQLIAVYGSLRDVAIITIAPEMVEGQVIQDLITDGIVISIGHSSATLSDGITAVKNGANFITHLFNAMLPFHHRDPGLVGLLTSEIDSQIYYGIIADGIHTHNAALSIAFRSNRDGCVLVTDAIAAMGLPSGSSTKIGDTLVEIRDGKALVSGTNTLSGSIATMDKCIRNLKKATGCSIVEAINCATLHPAKVLGIANRKGTLKYGADADFVLLDDELKVQSTWIDGQCVWSSK